MRCLCPTVDCKGYFGTCSDAQAKTFERERIRTFAKLWQNELLVKCLEEKYLVHQRDVALQDAREYRRRLAMFKQRFGDLGSESEPDSGMCNVIDCF